ncbi:hypothetical protein GCM10027088_43760 [Nocardia goodfellowii]|uniref:Uncharacterized protein n=1 Tax=Nocardia goodfellowii TaxID=882446 RepID=A0ABS4QKY5_9NOCA|nr:hypothetical protein [Nocardia goodfellowii]
MQEVFHPDQIEHSLTLLAAADIPDTGLVLDAARKSLAEYDQKLRRHRAALEAGADPVLVTGWIREVRQQRESVVAQIAALESKSKKLSSPGRQGN